MGRLRTDRFQGLPLSLIAVAGGYLTVLASGLARRMAQAQGMTDFDAAVFEALAPYRDPWLVAIFTWITGLGDMATLTAVSVIATVFLWTCGPVRLVVPVWICILGTQFTTWAGKFAIDRPRPDFLFEAMAQSPSFPSAHASGAMAVYGIIAYAVARGLEPPAHRFEIVYWTGILIALVAFSRVFLNVHYASDVAGGLMVGLFWLLAGIAAAELAAAQAVR
jgi:membrane-associated phospholipid phosphatase